MQRKFRILSAIAAGSLALAAVGISAADGTGRAAAHPALAAQMASFPPVSLDDCPTLRTGSSSAECVAQLQTDLNSLPGNHLGVDGIFGSQTRDAVAMFQQAHGLKQDGIVGPGTKKALDAALSVPTPTLAPPSSASAPASSATAPGQQATDPGQGIALGAGQDNCVDYSQGQVWQTSTSWVRARYRFCLLESGDGATVQPIVQVQFDWPTACSLSVGFPPSASVDCPLSTLDKQNLVIFQAYTNIANTPVTFQIPLAISQPNGLTYRGWCNYPPTNATKNTREYSFATKDRPTITCHGPLFDRLPGIYTVSTPGPRGDVKYDGSPARIMNGGSVQYISS